MFMVGIHLWLVSSRTLCWGQSLCCVPNTPRGFPHSAPVFLLSTTPILQGRILPARVPLFHRFRAAVYWLKHWSSCSIIFSSLLADPDTHILSFVITGHVEAGAIAHLFPMFPHYLPGYFSGLYSLLDKHCSDKTKGTISDDVDVSTNSNRS